MNELKDTKQAIDKAIASGAVTSVQMYNAIQRIPALVDNGAEYKGALTKYIIEQHMDEEMEMFLLDTMGYDSGFHRINVDHEGNISF